MEMIWGIGRDSFAKCRIFVNSFRELEIFKILRLEIGEQVNSEVIEHQSLRSCIYNQITFGNVEFSSSE